MKSNVTVEFYNGKSQSWESDKTVQACHAIHMSIDGCDVCVPWRFFSDGEIKRTEEVGKP